jgi:hypothetical protein
LGLYFNYIAHRVLYDKLTTEYNTSEVQEEARYHSTEEGAKDPDIKAC